MALQISIDNSTPLLLVGLLSLLLVHLFLRPSLLPPVHPFLWGRQSNFSNVRNKNESPVFTSAAHGNGGMNGFGRDKKTTLDCLGTLRWADGVVEIRALAAEIKSFMAEKSEAPGSGGVGVWAGEEEEGIGKEFMLTSASVTAEIVVSLACILAETPLFSFPRNSIPPASTVPPLSLLFVTSWTFSKARDFLQASNPQQKPVIVWLGRGADEGLEMLNGTAGLKIRRGSDLVSTGKDKTCSGVLDSSSQRVLMTSRSEEGKNHKLTHKALATSVLAIQALFPSTPTEPNAPPSNLSSHDRVLVALDTYTPLALATVFAALNKNAEVLLSGSEEVNLLSMAEVVKPTVIFAETKHLERLSRILEKRAQLKHGRIFGRALKTKIGYAREGVVLKDSWADRWVFQDVRNESSLSDVRCIVSVSNGDKTPLKMLDLLRSILGCPVISLLSHPTVPSPLFATQAYDMQVHRLSHPAAPDEHEMHYGPPAHGVEAKLVDVSEKQVQNGYYAGEILVKTEGRTQVVEPQDDEYVDLAASTVSQEEWLRTGWKAELRKNGTVRLLGGKL
ncbi:hypothetical protein BT69DRAFT_1296561 [Atractiella rhizophila]|nr:hypothetical protein BT69DRAFT_1296561 [Atractiella rhizophila]